MIEEKIKFSTISYVVSSAKMFSHFFESAKLQNGMNIQAMSARDFPVLAQKVERILKKTQARILDLGHFSLH